MSQISKLEASKADVRSIYKEAWMTSSKKNVSFSWLPLRINRNQNNKKWNIHAMIDFP